MTANQTVGFEGVHGFLVNLFDGDLHAKRVMSLANATLGVIRTASLAVNTIGQGLALARGLTTKHAVKQVDRLLSNEGIDIDAALLVRLAEALPADIKVCIVADRGFGDQKLYRVLSEELKFDYLIRFRGNIMVTAVDGEMRSAARWVGSGGRARILRGALVTAERR